MKSQQTLLLEEQIRAIAHQIWCDAGKPEGRANEHWFSAVQIVLNSFEQENNNAKKSRARKKPAEKNQKPEEVTEVFEDKKQKRARSASNG